MEAWRRELYQTLSHSVEGSTWKDHKYIAIVDGKYIYPEDVQNGSKSTASTSETTAKPASSATASTAASTVTAPKTPKVVKKQKDKDGKDVEVTDKGSVKTYKELPKDPQVGDMYLLEDTKRYVYWTGEIWTPVDETAVAAVAPSGAGAGGGGGSGTKEKKDSGSGGISQDTLNRAREAVKKLTSKNTESSSSKATKSAKTVRDTHQKSWNERKAAGKTAAISKSSSTNTVNSSLRALASKAISSLKKNTVNTGAKAVAKARGGATR